MAKTSTQAAAILAIVALVLTGVFTSNGVQPATWYLTDIARQSGLEAPVLVDGYAPVHPMDKGYRVCYRTSPSTTGGIYCVTERDETGPGLGWGGCVGLDIDRSWCSRDELAEEFEIRYDHDPKEFPAGWDEKARSNGLYGPQPVDVRGPNERCFRFGPDDGTGVWCWYEEIDRDMFRNHYLSPCVRGYGGSFWCQIGEHRSAQLPPYDAETWTWSWMDPR